MMPCSWDLHFGHLKLNRTGTVAIGEWGGRMIRGWQLNWMLTFAAYLCDKHLIILLPIPS